MAPAAVSCVALAIFAALSVPAGAYAEMDVLVNQIGYPPNAPKFFRVQRTADFVGGGAFSVRSRESGVTVFSGTLGRQGGLWDRWYWTGDFSSLRTPGRYCIEATIDGESATSYDFTIDQDILLNHSGTLVYEYFRTQRCGVAVPGWHGLCHMDDGIRDDTGQNIDAVGGWHDAGDYNKFADGCQGDGVLYLLWLYDAYRDYYDAIDADANGLADIVDEALHGTRWLAKMVQPDGRVLGRTAKRRWGSTWVRPEADTDNVVGNYDDRWIQVGEEGVPQTSMVCAALIRMHEVLESLGRPTEAFADKALAVWNYRVAWAAGSGWPANLGFPLTQLWAGLALYARFGQQNCYDLALDRVNQEALAWIADPGRNDAIWDHPMAMDLGMFAWVARRYPDTTAGINARNALLGCMSHNLDLADNPLGLIKRKDGSSYYFFQSNPDWNGFFLGLNRLYLLLTWASVEAYKTTGDPAYLRFAMDHYNWVMGANCDRVCMMENAGQYDLPRYHTRYDTIPGHEDGAQPGVVPNGYVRVYTTGLPHIDLVENRYQSNEGWLVNNAAYAMALSSMSVFEDTASYVSDTIPARMYPGRTYPVSVTMRNSGYMPWDPGRHRLGAVGDSDPFAAARQYISGGVTVGAGEPYTWTFQMTPTTPGNYVTDWRLVQEGVCWFGDTLTREVEVLVPAAPGPVTQLTAAAAPGKVTLSWINPADEGFSGTMIRCSTTGYPADRENGLLVVDKSNVPGSSDSYVHEPLTNGVAHYYAAFAHDPLGNYSVAATTWAKPLAVADFDRDGDVDQDDFGAFQICCSGDGRSYPARCDRADFDFDGDVDNDDLLTFQGCMGGPARPPGC